MTLAVCCLASSSFELLFNSSLLEQEGRDRRVFRPFSRLRVFHFALRHRRETSDTSGFDAPCSIRGLNNHTAHLKEAARFSKVALEANRRLRPRLNVDARPSLPSAPRCKKHPSTHCLTTFCAEHVNSPSLSSSIAWSFRPPTPTISRRRLRIYRRPFPSFIAPAHFSARSWSGTVHSLPPPRPYS